MLSRRAALTSLAGAGCFAVGLGAARADKVLKIGTVHPGQLITPEHPLGKVLVDALAQHGYVLGGNLALEARTAKGDLTRLPHLMDELRASGVDLLITIGYPTALAAKATGLPTVIAFGSGDPVATGLVESWAHPGGNLTGISDIATTLTSKRLELLKAFAPQLRRVAMLWNKDDLGMSLRYQASATTAQSLNITVQPLGVREPDDFEGALAAMDREKPDAILMVADSLTVLNRKRVFDYAMARRLPAIYEYDNIIRDGGLMSYGPDLSESMTRAAAMVSRILKGTHPGDIPFETPTRYLFVLNLKVAKATGFDPPLNLLALADEVIE
jgi:putative ABC transport system substrate-binding protein